MNILFINSLENLSCIVTSLMLEYSNIIFSPLYAIMGKKPTPKLTHLESLIEISSEFQFDFGLCIFFCLPD